MPSVLDSYTRPAPSRQRTACSISTRAPWGYISTLFLPLQSSSSRALSLSCALSRLESQTVLRSVSDPPLRFLPRFSYHSSVSSLTLHTSQVYIFAILAVRITLPLLPITRDLSATPTAFLIRGRFLLSITTFLSNASPPWAPPNIRTLHFRWSLVKL
jgi:hypothetical protein